MSIRPPHPRSLLSLLAAFAAGALFAALPRTPAAARASDSASAAAPTQPTALPVGTQTGQGFLVTTGPDNRVYAILGSDTRRLIPVTLNDDGLTDFLRTPIPFIVAGQSFVLQLTEGKLAVINLDGQRNATEIIAYRIKP